MGQCSTNKAGIDSLQQRLQQLDSLGDQVDQKAAGGNYSASGIATLKKLHSQVAQSHAALQKEVELRQKVAVACSSSQYAKPDNDPAVQKALKDFNIYKKQQGSKIVSNSRLDTPCVPCMKHKLDAVKDCNKLYWASSAYGSGPSYPGGCNQHTLATFLGWDDLISKGLKTDSEKQVLKTMSANEGPLDAVQGYDDQVVSVGAMQKTLRPDGHGELADQLLDFQANNPDKYNELFASKGWTVDRQQLPSAKAGGPPRYGPATMYFQDPADSDAGKMTGSALKSYIDKPDDPDLWNRAFGPLHQAGQDTAFQKQQVCDFNGRLKGAMSKSRANTAIPSTIMFRLSRLLPWWSIRM